MQGQINTIPHPIMTDLQERVGRLEDNQNQSLKESAERNTAIALLSKDVKDIKEDVGTIHKGISKVLWTIIGAVLTTGVGIGTTFVLTGGLN